MRITHRQSFSDRVEVPPLIGLILETEEEKRRLDEAVARWVMGLAEKVRERKDQR